jgi:hypothetical protein
MASEKTTLLSRLGVAALIAMAVGITGSFVLFLSAGHRTPRLLLLGMAIWMLSPFLVLGWAHLISKRWSPLVRMTLYCLMVVVPLFSLLVYGDDAFVHHRTKAAFVYVAVPPASWLLIAIALSVAAFISRRQSRRPPLAP